MQFSSINLKDYTYNLPDEKIAFFPSDKRDESKLLVARTNKQTIEDRNFKDVIDILSPDTFLIANHTKVIAARLLVQKSSGGNAEILLLEPIKPSFDPQIAMQAKGESTWNAIIGGRKIKAGTKLFFKSDNIQIEADILEKNGNEAIVRLNWSEKISLAEVLDEIGKIPLPPYIKRTANQEDKLRYQTVFANNPGSVAAPTAGLHFTNEIIDKLQQKGVKFSTLTLHVGAGTFKPINSENISDHDMHSELIIIEKSLIQDIRDFLASSKNNIISVGTTATRSLETLYWIACKTYLGKFSHKNDLLLDQWESFELAKLTLPTKLEAFESLVKYMESNNLSQIIGKTKLLILPGYQFRLIYGLFTNFHAPDSTLILLVATFLGQNFWKNIYDHALNSNYRFLSYGDSSLLLKD